MFVEPARRPFSLSGFTTSAASWSCCIVLRDVWHTSDFRSRCQNPSQHAIFIIRMAYANRESLLTFACRRCESNQGFLKPCLDSAGVNIACLERWTMNEDVRSSSWTWGVFIAVPMFVCLKIRKLTMQVQQMVCRFPQKLAVLICIYIYIIKYHQLLHDGFLGPRVVSHQPWRCEDSSACNHTSMVWADPRRHEHHKLTIFDKEILLLQRKRIFFWGFEFLWDWFWTILGHVIASSLSGFKTLKTHASPATEGTKVTVRESRLGYNIGHRGPDSGNVKVWVPPMSTPNAHQKGFPYIPIHGGDLKYTSNTPQNKRLSCLLSFCNQELRIIQESCQSCV